eukprot:11188044-Lingulodinium_polyedra.AAC.1
MARSSSATSHAKWPVCSCPCQPPKRSRNAQGSGMAGPGPIAEPPTCSRMRLANCLPNSPGFSRSICR